MPRTPRRSAAILLSQGGLEFASENQDGPIQRGERARGDRGRRLDNDLLRRWPVHFDLRSNNWTLRDDVLLVPVHPAGQRDEK